ncbi:MAG: carboxypeptidase regulatory-like domain-containing protein, partial [Chitinophagaceae bacterium]
MRFRSQLAVLALVALTLGSCLKHDTYPAEPGPGQAVQPVLPDPITATLHGTVQDETGAPASGVTVQVGAQTASTDARGFFRITGAALDKNQAVVTATK